MSDFINDLATKELVEKLIANGHEEAVNAFLLNENRCYTKQGRLNKSGACRVLGVKPKQLDDQFIMMRKLLEGDIVEE